MDSSSVDRLLTRGVEEIIDKKHLEGALKSGKKLRVKLGIDPTAKDLHLGHTVVLRKLRQFQELGHKAVLIIGDFTATIGDPSGRSELRPVLTEREAKTNMRGYLKEMGKAVDVGKAEVRYNSEWYKKKGLKFLIEITSKFTVARSLERDDFQKRIKEGRDVSMLEVLYPILQGYDSVEVKADVELGGTDQKFNLLTGRKVQRRYGLPKQDIITVPLIEGLDGVRKMSKSFGNSIGLSEKPLEMYSKIMSIPDDLVRKYFLLLTDVPEKELELLKPERRFENINFDFKAWKERLGLEITDMYHDRKKAALAKAAFDKKFGKGKSLKDIQADFEIQKKPGKYAIVDLLVEGKLASSKTEARRKIKEGAVEIDGAQVSDEKKVVKITKGSLIRLGKRFLRIK
ncbi:MAG: tyrosine--tRNA ligase [Candidatus Doudnabacteria bacterium]|nr:tyrosine--tRNA ligase [Candidatus Doudnabacteria bacterium]